LDVLKIPYQKQKSSDELTEVEKMPLVFNELSALLNLHITPSNSSSAEDHQLALEWDSVRTGIADTITEIAS
jgi:hypothetical protein